MTGARLALALKRPHLLKTMSKIYVIHENEAWVEPLRAAFQEQGLPFEEWFLDKGVLAFDGPVDEGIRFLHYVDDDSEELTDELADEEMGADI